MEFLSLQFFFSFLSLSPRHTQVSVDRDAHSAWMFLNRAGYAFVRETEGHPDGGTKGAKPCRIVPCEIAICMLLCEN